MLTAITALIILSILASVFVITASMLSSRLSRVEDRFITEDFETDASNSKPAVGDAPQSIL